MTESTQKQIEAYLRDFTEREDRLMEIVNRTHVQLPERLKHWRLWIADPQIYLNELKNFVDTIGRRPWRDVPEMAALERASLTFTIGAVLKDKEERKDG